MGLQLGHGSFSFSYIVLLPGLGGKEYGHTASFQLGLFIQCRHLGTLLGEAHQQVFADVGMRHLAAAEADRDLDAVAVGKELLGILELCVEIADIDAIGDFERISDHAVNLTESAEKMHEQGLALTRQGKQELDSLSVAVRDIIFLTTRVFENMDSEHAPDVEPLKK